MANERDDSNPLVLRTVYLPKNLDDALRQLAHDMSKSKNELIREGVQHVIREHDPSRTDRKKERGGSEG